MNIKDVVGGEDNIIVVTINAKSLDDLFFSTDIPVAANLRLAVKMNGSESISSDYLPLSPFLSSDQIIEYTTVTGERMDYKNFFRIQRNGSEISLTDSHVNDTWRILIESLPFEDNLFSCDFNNYYPKNDNDKLKSLSFVTPIELEFLSFNGCRTLVKADLLNVNTKNVTNMRSMFSNCSSLVSLDLSGFDTKNVISMIHMFADCSALASLDLSGFDTKNVTDMYGMFVGCSSLVSLDLSGFDTKNVTGMVGMFAGCKSLISLNLSGFDTREVMYMDDIFDQCDNLKEIIMRGCDENTINRINRERPPWAVIITD